jgi:hypothetical protein
MLNTRANIAFNLLPIIALLLCAMALYAFFNLDADINQPSQELALMSAHLGVMQQYIETSAKIIVADAASHGFTAASVQESARRHDLHLEGEGNFFIKIEQGEFKIDKSGNFVILAVDGVFIQSRQGSNFGQRNLDIKLEADPSGEFIKFINK